LSQGCEREVADAANQEQKNESLMRLSWALVHSGQPEDVNRGIGMLEGDASIHLSMITGID
jgi:fission 1 protein